MSLPQYDRTKSYKWNYDNAPDAAQREAAAVSISLPGDWTYAGLTSTGPLAVAAGPLLNSGWILYYAALGFDVLTYKTVRSRHRDCYAMPNLVPVAANALSHSQSVDGMQILDGSWAISFGMPSQAPTEWTQDVAQARTKLPADKLLSVSVVASAEPDWNTQQVADDYAECAHMAVESGADCVELNLSCPNVSSVDGQLFQDHEASRCVVETTRDRIGDIPLILKIGHVTDETQAHQLVEAIKGRADALAMINCIACQVQENGKSLFDGQPRGIGGVAIRDAAIAQVQRFRDAAIRNEVRLLGVGGISSASNVRQCLNAGSEAVQIATAAMLDPLVAQRIKSELQN